MGSEGRQPYEAVLPSGRFAARRSRNDRSLPPARPMRTQTLRSLDDHVGAGLFWLAAAAELIPVAGRFAIGVSPEMATVMSAAPEGGPVHRQFIPDLRELLIEDIERHDPIGDDAHSPSFGLVHRYPDRVLFKLVSVCPVYCRFCFRREMVGPAGDGAMSEDDIAAAVAYVTARPQIREVILTGGDPFMLSARRVGALMERLNAVGHLDVIRWHTRVPVVAPSRLSDAFLAALAQSDKTVVEALRGRLSGLAQPTYVLDLPGGAGKVPVTHALIADGGAYNWAGEWHVYPPAPAKPGHGWRRGRARREWQ